MPIPLTLQHLQAADLKERNSEDTISREGRVQRTLSAESISTKSYLILPDLAHKNKIQASRVKQTECWRSPSTLKK